MAAPSPRHFLTLLDLSSQELLKLIARARELKALRGTGRHPRPLEGKTVAVLLEKASTRTRISFEVGIHELGGNALTLVSRDTQLGRGEPIEDTARMLSGYVHAVAFRTFGHERAELLAKHASIPIINALTDRFHPCQLLADLMTMDEERAGFEGRKVAWVGDGNNMAHSWILASALLGFDLTLACPQGYHPEPAVLKLAEQARAGRGSVRVVGEVATAVEGADVVTTDVWASMGQEDEKAAREKAFAGFCVDGAHMARASKDAIFLHCLPAHRGEEVQAEVIDGPAARVWAEAENRLHAQKALLELLLAR